MNKPVYIHNFGYRSRIISLSMVRSNSRAKHGTTDWFQIRKGLHQGRTLSPCLIKLHAECKKQNVGLDEAKAGIKTARRNINNIRCAGDHPYGRKPEGELKSPLMKVKKQSEKTGLKLNIQKKRKIITWSHHFMANRWENSGNSDRFYIPGLQNHSRW